MENEIADRIRLAIARLDAVVKALGSAFPIVAGAALGRYLGGMLNKISPQRRPVNSQRGALFAKVRCHQMPIFIVAHACTR